MTSTARGGSGPAGAARAALAASSTPPGIVEIEGHRGTERLEVGLTCQRGVERLEASGGAHEQPAGVAAASLLQGDLPAQALHLRGPQGVRRAGLDRDQQAECSVECPGIVLGGGGREQALCAATRFGRQRRCALEECRRRGQAAAALGSVGGALELLGDFLVGARGGLGEVPGAAVGIDLCVGDLRKGAVRALSLLKRRGLVGRRAHQRMAEPHARVELDQAGLYGRGRRVGPDREPLCGSPEQRRLADRIGRRELQQSPCLDRKRVEPPPEALLDPPRERHRGGEPETARQLGGRHAPRQLQQRQRVAARLGDDLVPDTGVQGACERRFEQRARIVVAQALDQELRESRQLIAGRASGEDQAHRFGLEAAGDEREHLRRGAIEPLLVIHHADQRLLLGHLGEQAQHGEADEEAVRRGSGTGAEGRAQRIALRSRKTLEPVEHRSQELMQPGEGELHLRLDAGGTHDQAVRCLLDQVIQQRGLAHARFATDDQRPALTCANGFDEPAEHVALAAPTL